MRIGYSEDEDYPGQFDLWQANCDRSIRGKRGQVALKELEAALLALPEKRLIAGTLKDSEGAVCALGALGEYKGREIKAEPQRPNEGANEDEWDRYWDESSDGSDMEEFGVSLGMPRLVAWKVVAKNDIEIDGHYKEQYGPPLYRNGYPCRLPVAFIPVTPEERYEEVLAWVRKQIGVVQ